MRRLLLLALKALAILAYAVVFGELFLRVFAPQPLVPRYVTGAPDGVRANIPNVSFRQWTPEVDVRVRYNDRGMRDDRPAPPIAKSAGECRVALLGDSYFVGFEAAYRDSFAWRLEQKLRAAGRPCRVLDFAVSGFGTAEMLVAYRSRVRPYHPDLVIASWHASDPNDNVRSNLFQLEGDGRLKPANATFLPGVEASDELMRSPTYRWLIENSHLYSAVRERAGVAAKTFLSALRGRAKAGEPGEGGGEGEGEIAPGVARQGDPALDEALLGELDAEVRADSGRFLLFDIPAMRARVQFFSALALLPPALLDRLDIASPLAEFQASASPDRKLYWERGHRHWTPLGADLAATVAADAILERGLVPAPAAAR